MDPPCGGLPVYEPVKEPQGFGVVHAPSWSGGGAVGLSGIPRLDQGVTPFNHSVVVDDHPSRRLVTGEFIHDVQEDLLKDGP